MMKYEENKCPICDGMEEYEVAVFISQTMIMAFLVGLLVAYFSPGSFPEQEHPFLFATLVFMMLGLFPCAFLQFRLFLVRRHFRLIRDGKHGDYMI